MRNHLNRSNRRFSLILLVLYRFVARAVFRNNQTGQGIGSRSDRSNRSVRSDFENHGENSLPKHFWAEAVNTACSVQNRVLIRPMIEKTPYELWRGRRPNIAYFHPFGCECYVLNTKDQFGKFDSKVDKGIFLGYFDTSKAYRVFNTRTLVVEESMHVKFNDGLTSNRRLSDLEDDFADMQIDPSVAPKSDEIQTLQEILPQIEGVSDSQTRDWKFITYHPQDQIIGDQKEGVKTRSSFRDQASYAFASEIEQKTIDEALTDDD